MTEHRHNTQILTHPRSRYFFFALKKRFPEAKPRRHKNRTVKRKRRYHATKMIFISSDTLTVPEEHHPVGDDHVRIHRGYIKAVSRSPHSRLAIEGIRTTAAGTLPEHHPPCPRRTFSCNRPHGHHGHHGEDHGGQSRRPSDHEEEHGCAVA